MGTTYGSGFMHRWLTATLRVLDVRLVYWFARLFVVPPTLLVNRRARGIMHRFYRQRFSCSRLKAAWLTYCNFCDFAQVVIDRFAMYAGKRFTITIDGYDHFLTLSQQPEGFVQLSSHIGNYELAGYSLTATDKPLNALVFAGEKESVMQNRSRMFQGNNIRMIPVQADMSHLFTLNSALASGQILSMPADRVFGSQKHFAISFLGEEARFPQGPFIMAAVRRAPMLFVAVMKTGAKRYSITVRRLPQPAEALPSGEYARHMATAYVQLLEQTVRQHPTQWYNYFDFWAK